MLAAFGQPPVNAIAAEQIERADECFVHNVSLMIDFENAKKPCAGFAGTVQTQPNRGRNDVVSASIKCFAMRWTEIDSRRPQVYACSADCQMTERGSGFARGANRRRVSDEGDELMKPFGFVSVVNATARSNHKPFCVFVLDVVRPTARGWNKFALLATTLDYARVVEENRPPLPACYALCASRRTANMGWCVRRDDMLGT
jgi:hypothetical protein